MLFDIELMSCWGVKSTVQPAIDDCARGSTLMVCNNVATSTYNMMNYDYLLPFCILLQCKYTEIKNKNYIYTYIDGYDKAKMTQEMWCIIQMLLVKWCHHH